MITISFRQMVTEKKSNQGARFPNNRVHLIRKDTINIRMSVRVVGEVVCGVRTSQSIKNSNPLWSCKISIYHRVWWQREKSCLDFAEIEFLA